MYIGIAMKPQRLCKKRPYFYTGKLPATNKNFLQQYIHRNLDLKKILVQHVNLVYILLTREAKNEEFFLNNWPKNPSKPYALGSWKKDILIEV